MKQKYTIQDLLELMQPTPKEELPLCTRQLLAVEGLLQPVIHNNVALKDRSFVQKLACEKSNPAQAKL